MDRRVYSVVILDCGNGQWFHAIAGTREEAYLALERGFRRILTEEQYEELMNTSRTLGGREIRQWFEFCCMPKEIWACLGSHGVSFYVNEMRPGMEFADGL